tara:strand:- start:71 stop:382 length:312 start_codon:yes stop_codon:yes gene_type:complete
MSKTKKQSQGRELRRKKTSEVQIGKHKYKIPLTVHQILTQETKIKETLANGILRWYDMFQEKKVLKEDWHASEHNLVNLSKALLDEIKILQKEKSGEELIEKA